MDTDADNAVNGTASAAHAAAEGQPDYAALLADAEKRADENNSKFLYAMADFENYKKRIERQLAEISLAGKKSVLKKMLPVLDNLERALQYPDGEGLRNGLQGTLRGFEGAFASEGVKALSLKGEPFDPAVAEAIGTQPSPGTHDDIVLEEAARAYMIGDEVLRPAQVIVCKNPQ
jgi:molecular chaperone GrpE